MFLRKILTTLAIVAPLTAFADQSGVYGTAGGCNHLFGYALNDQDLDDTGVPDYFDGQKLGGQDWQCNISGSCESDGGPYTLSISAITEEAEAKLTIDGATFTLPRCPEVPAS